MPRAVPFLTKACLGTGASAPFAGFAQMEEASETPKVPFELATLHECLRSSGEPTQQFHSRGAQRADCVARHVEGL